MAWWRSSRAPGSRPPDADTPVPAPAPAAVAAARRGALLAAAREAAASGPLVLTVRGDSMTPAFADGERVEIARPRLYLPGDVVAFAAPYGRLLVHRLLGFRPWAGGLAAITRGDACPAPDAPVPHRRLLGRVVGRPDLTPPSARAAALRALLAAGWAGLQRRAARRLARWQRPAPR
jgi:hypothetical protein